ncbi:hypothetical protein [Flavobacterium cyclinae]|uniref:hypothetical protein n=1 Tax=Flavobacterium cyclinae TaxID=2895947 RepID=UPI001E453515|nr:hypothetical protein [Flavobacterium cyclinae]UGS21051.1 hypothetical protein LOS86_00060 [Flavobacterium cyclinae]
MKKMIFSAVALVAFSFASMANEIEEKKVELKSEKNITKDCCEISDATFDGAVKAGIHWSQAQYIALAAYNECNKLNK